MSSGAPRRGTVNIERHRTILKILSVPLCAFGASVVSDAANRAYLS